MKLCESLMSTRFSLRPIAGVRLPLPAPHWVREARSTLQAGGRFRFSIPDRSRVDLGDAGRDGGALVMAAGPVGARALADQLGEPRAERPQRCVADREADLGDAEVATTQQRHRALDAPRHEVAVRRLAVGAPELAAEVPGRHVRAAGERLDVQRLRVLPVDPVANAAQPREVAQVLRCGGSAGHLRDHATSHRSEVDRAGPAATQAAACGASSSTDTGVAGWAAFVLSPPIAACSPTLVSIMATSCLANVGLRGGRVALIPARVILRRRGCLASRKAYGGWRPAG